MVSVGAIGHRSTSMLDRKERVENGKVSGVVVEPAVVWEELTDAIKVCGNGMKDRKGSKGWAGPRGSQGIGQEDAPVVAGPACSSALTALRVTSHP